jgi:hypothetical protein
MGAMLAPLFDFVLAGGELIEALHGTLWIEAGVLVLTAGPVALLPLRAREEGHH